MRLPPSRARRYSWLVEGEGPIDAEAVGQLRRKYEQPLLQAVVRLSVAGTDPPQSHALVGRTWSSLQRLNAPGGRVVRRYLASGWVARRLQRFQLPLLRWPLLVNARELLGLAGLPLSGDYLPGPQLGPLVSCQCPRRYRAAG